MKKLVVLLLAAMMTLSLVACGGNKDNQTPNTENNKNTEADKTQKQTRTQKTRMLVQKQKFQHLNGIGTS